MFLLLPLGASGERQASRVETREVAHYTLPGLIQSLDLARDSDLAAAGVTRALGETVVLVFRPRSGATVREITFDTPISIYKLRRGLEPIRVRFSPDGQILAVSYVNRIHLYQVGTWVELRALGIDAEAVVSLPAPPKSIEPAKEPQSLPDPEANPAEYQRQWAEILADWARFTKEDAREAERIQQHGDGRTRVTDLAFSPDGRHLLASYCRGQCWLVGSDDRHIFWYAGGDDPVRLWDVSTGRPIWEKYYDPREVVATVTISADGKRFAVASEGRGVRFDGKGVGFFVGDIVTGEQLFVLPRIYFQGYTPSVSFTPESQLVLTRWDAPITSRKQHRARPWTYRYLAAFDAQTGGKRAEIRDPDGTLEAALSPDGRWLVTSGWRITTGWGSPKKMKIWDFADQRAVADIDISKTVLSRRIVDWIRFSPDGKHLLLANSTEGLVVAYSWQTN